MRCKQKTIVWVTSYLLFLLCFLGPLQPVHAERLPRFIDQVGVLTPDEMKTITNRLDEISVRHNFDLVIAVVQSVGYREAHHFAADFFEQNDFGFGPNLDGAILLLAMRDREFGFATLGRGLTVFTPSGQEYLDKLFLPELKKDRFFQAFLAYASAVDDFLNKAQRGEPYERGNIPLTPSERNQYFGVAIFGSLFGALLIALTVTLIWRGQLKTRRQEYFAQQYIREKSLVLTSQRDVFLHRHVRRVKRDDNRKGSSGRGGSFKTSSGRRSSGHSGKF